MIKSPFSREVTVLHQGHIGDIIAFIPIYRKLNATRLVVTDATWGEAMSGFKYNSLKPLLDSQDIPSEINSSSLPIDYDTTNWRECYKDYISLMDSQARFLGVVDKINGHFEITEPWLKVEADPLTKNRVIFNRSPRYRNNSFPWKKVLKFFGDKALFIGADHEYADFCNAVGNVERYHTASCLEVAKAIEGADFFVGNQSSAFWIAAGLRKPLLQETYIIAPNSIVPYEGAWYSLTGDVNFDKLGK